MEIQDYDVNIYFIPLFNDLSYTTSFVINNTQCTLNFGYNSRLNQRFFNVTTSSGIVLLQNTFIQLKNNIKLNVNFDFLGNGTTDIYFKKIDETLPLDILSWASNVEMYVRTVPPESKSQESYNNIAVWVTDTESTTNSIDDGSSVAEEIVSEEISCSNSTSEITYTYTLSDGKSSDYFLYKFTYNNISYDYTINTSGEDKQEGSSNGIDFVVRDNTNNVISNIPNLYFNWIRQGKEIKLTVRNQVDSTTKITQSIFGDETDVGITMNKVLGQDIYTVDRDNLIGESVASGNPSIIRTETGYLEMVKFCLSAQQGV